MTNAWQTFVAHAVDALADDDDLMFAMGAIQVDLEPGYTLGPKLRAEITRQAAHDVRCLARALREGVRAPPEGPPAAS